MHPFKYVRADSLDAALAASKGKDVVYLAGGTTLVDLMRLDVMRPRVIVDITRLPLGAIEERDGTLRLGAMARNSDVAYHPAVARDFPALSEALLSGASPQLRNMATVGGNILQRTRCAYFRDGAWSCNKRTPGAGCSATDGDTRMHAVLGAGDDCIAVNPSDMCVALAALDATIHSRRQDGRERSIPFGDFHTLPAGHPEIENVLEPGELILWVDVPVTPFGRSSHYVKLRDRASYAFALASAAVCLDIQAGIVRAARVALGGVATRPWRSPAAEAELVGKAPSMDAFRRAGAAAMAGARPRKDNAFKVELAQRTVVRALRELTETT